VRSHSRYGNAPKALIVALLAAVVWVGCSDDSVIAPDSQPADLDLTELAPDIQIQELAPTTLVLERNNLQLMRRQGVVATAVGLTDEGRPAIRMYTTGLVLDDLPENVDGIPVIVIETGPIVALQEAQDRGELDPRAPKCESPPCGKPGGGGSDDGGGSFDPTVKHRPAPNGVSLGHPAITAGTLGAVVKRGNSTFILSNNHVLANENIASMGDDALQPGPYDGGTGAVIGTLSDFVLIVFSTSANNRVDAAIALVNPTDVTGAAPSYGAPRSQTITASVGMRVMKYGRTTEHTKGRVQGIHATVNVGYSTGTARFVDQIIIGGGGFSAGGDSGSLIVVEKGGNARKPVALLFAGGGGVTIANPIDEVLGAFGVTIDGN